MREGVGLCVCGCGKADVWGKASVGVEGGKGGGKEGKEVLPIGKGCILGSIVEASSTNEVERCPPPPPTPPVFTPLSTPLSTPPLFFIVLGSDESASLPKSPPNSSSSSSLSSSSSSCSSSSS